MGTYFLADLTSRLGTLTGLVRAPTLLQCRRTVIHGDWYEWKGTVIDRCSNEPWEFVASSPGILCVHIILYGLVESSLAFTV